MTACRTAAFAAHAAARDAIKIGAMAAVAAARAAGQACAFLARRGLRREGIGLNDNGKVDRETERAWQ